MEEKQKNSEQRYEDEEIHLLDYFIILLKHKRMIISMVLVTGIVAVIISFMMTKIYLSESTITPIEQERSPLSGAVSALGGLGAMFASQVGIGSTGSLEKFEVVLKSRELTNQVIQKHDLMPIIFYEIWDEKAGRWKKEKPPTLEDAYRVVVKENMLKTKPEKKNNVLRLSFEYPNAITAQTILSYYIEGLSEFLRQTALEAAKAQKEHLTQQMMNTSDPILKAKLAELTAQQVEKEVLAKVQKYYSFNVIDPPFVPDKKYKPKTLMICILSVTVAFFVAVFLAFFLEYLGNVRKHEDPERLNSLRNYLRWRKA